MIRLTILFLLVTATPVMSQVEITWNTLDDVQFSGQYNEEAQANFYYPNFGSAVKALEGKQVYLEGYMLVIDPIDGIYVLSRYPYASCFFCGSGGPESVVELELLPGNLNFKMDQRITILGTLELNYDDIYQCNYILRDARVYR